MALNHASSTKFYKEKFVSIKSDKPIDSNHLDILLMFFECVKLSGGGNIVSHKINQRMDVLTLEYEHRLFKHRVLEKKYLDFHGYKLEASDPDSELVDPVVIDHCLLIIKNVPEDLDDYVVKIFAQNLAMSVEDEAKNSVAFIYRSHNFRHVFYVRYENEINFEYCLQRLMRRPTLNERVIEIQQGHITNTLFFKDNGAAKKNLSLESIQDYFENKKKFEVNPLVLCKNYDSFFLLKFCDQQAMKNFLIDAQRGSFLDKISLSGTNLWENVLFENVFDLELFQKEVSRLNQKEFKNSSGDLTENTAESKVIASKSNDIALNRFSNNSQFDKDIIQTNGDPKKNKIRYNYYRVKNYINYKI